MLGANLPELPSHAESLSCRDSHQAEEHAKTVTALSHTSPLRSGFFHSEIDIGREHLSVCGFLEVGTYRASVAWGNLLSSAKRQQTSLQEQTGQSKTAAEEMFFGLGSTTRLAAPLWPVSGWPIMESHSHTFCLRAPVPGGNITTAGRRKALTI